MKSNNPNTETEPNRNVIMAGGLALNVGVHCEKTLSKRIKNI